MNSVYIIGSYSSAFGRFPDKSFRDLTREAVMGVLKDAGLDSGECIQSVWFGNVLMDYWGQHSTRGQFALIPLLQAGVLAQRVPILNVENGCATGSVALQGAIKDIRAGEADFALAVGVEKTFRPNATPEETFAMFRAGENAFNPDETLDEYRELARLANISLQFGPNRTMFMDTYAVQAAYHMQRWGTTQRQIAAAASQAHNHAVMNPLAQYRFPMTVDDVLADREVSFPLTRAMCAPIGDGGAAALVCSEKGLSMLPPAVRERAVAVAASVLRSGIYRKPDEPSLAREAGDKAYVLAGVAPGEVDVAEVHDATSFGEIYNTEMMRFCEIGQGGPFVESGATALGGQIPINTSGGLVSKGHPIAASGLSMINEIVVQLRHEAGERQVIDAHIGLIENGGGIMGLEEAACAVTILKRTHH